MAETAARELSIDEKLRVYGDPEADFTVLSWGSNKGGILEAIERLDRGDVAHRFPLLDRNLERDVRHGAIVHVEPADAATLREQ